MGAASLVATSLGIILLIVTAYVVVGGIISTNEEITSAQGDMTAVHMNMIATSMQITDILTDNTSLYINVINNGNEPILDFEAMDVYLQSAGSVPVLYTYEPAGGSGHWKIEYLEPDNICPNQWDPGELLNLSITTEVAPARIQITTGNGASAQTIC